MTPEEKARERAKTSMSLCMDSTDEDDIYCEDLVIAYLAGYDAAKSEAKELGKITHTCGELNLN